MRRRARNGIEVPISSRAARIVLSKQTHVRFRVKADIKEYPLMIQSRTSCRGGAARISLGLSTVNRPGATCDDSVATEGRGSGSAPTGQRSVKRRVHARLSPTCANNSTGELTRL